MTDFEFGIRITALIQKKKFSREFITEFLILSFFIAYINYIIVQKKIYQKFGIQVGKEGLLFLSSDKNWGLNSYI